MACDSGVPEICWRPSEDERRPALMKQFAEVIATRTGRDIPDYDALWRYSTDETGQFWQAAADYFDLRWHSDPGSAIDTPVMPGARWFAGGTLNYAEHALAPDRGRGPDDVAVIETDESGHERMVTLSELRALVGAAQAGLARLGVGAGMRVAALVPNRLEALVSFLATAALGAVWSSCSPDFGAASVIDRFEQIEPTVLIAVDGYTYGGKRFDTTGTAEQIRAALPDLAGFVHIPFRGTPAPEGAITWAELIAIPEEPTFTPVEFNDPLWVLYSSGTTGLPKAIVHSVGGIVLEHLKMLALHQDLRPGSRFFWFTTTGWMMWNYLVGGLLAGAAVVLYDGSPGRPDLMSLWRMAAKYRVEWFGVSAAFIQACRAAELNPAAEVDLSCVRAVGSTGSPLSPDGFDWVAERIGREVQVVSLSGGTDVCTAVVGGAPTVPVWRGEISTRMLGAAVEAFDPSGKPLVGEVGELVITKPMPSMPVRFWGDEDGSRLRAAYFEQFPGVWRHGDWVRISDRGSILIEGRSDATLNRGGIRMGTAEFYRVVEHIDGIVDSLVVDTSSSRGPGDLVLFVVLAHGADARTVITSVKSTVRVALSPRHIPGVVIPVPMIPRTLNGKKCEVPVKRILTGATVADVISRDALADPDAFDTFVDLAQSAIQSKARHPAS